MLYHIHTLPGSLISVPEMKRLIAFLVKHDGDRPTKRDQIGWLADLNELARNLAILSDGNQIRSRSSAPIERPTLSISVPSLEDSCCHLFELVDGDMRINGLSFDFLDNISFRFGSHHIEICGMSDEDWTLARLSDTMGLLSGSNV